MTVFQNCILIWNEELRKLDKICTALCWDPCVCSWKQIFFLHSGQIVWRIVNVQKFYNIICGIFCHFFSFIVPVDTSLLPLDKMLKAARQWCGGRTWTLQLHWLQWKCLSLYGWVRDKETVHICPLLAIRVVSHKVSWTAHGDDWGWLILTNSCRCIGFGLIGK